LRMACPPLKACRRANISCSVATKFPRHKHAYRWSFGCCGWDCCCCWPPELPCQSTQVK
jgi:hypothetical protein